MKLTPGQAPNCEKGTETRREGRGGEVSWEKLPGNIIEEQGQYSKICEARRGNISGGEGGKPVESKY